MYDFGFGDSFGVREALHEQISVQNLMKEAKPYLGYPSKQGDLDLETKILKLVKDSTGDVYKKCILVSGAHMGIAASLKALEVKNSNFVHYDELYFLRYPQIVRTMGFTSIPKEEYDRGLGILLTASPSNPEGKICMNWGKAETTIWDAAYHNEIYISPVACTLTDRPKHCLMVGSAGKLTGMNGLRFGWVCTNDEALAEQVRLAHYNLTLGVNTVSMALMNVFIDKVDLPVFYNRAYNMICDNKSELSKLEYLFNHPVPRHGMFWFTEVDSKVRDLLKRSKVTYTEGYECGGSPDTIRITMGQARDITKRMVQAVLKEDGK